MKSKRKRKRSGSVPTSAGKRQKIEGGPTSRNCAVKEAVLAQYYTTVLSLRQYMLSKLPKTSKIRRKRILNLGHRNEEERQQDASLGLFLDKTLIGLLRYDAVSEEERLQQWGTFSQRGDTSLSTLTAVSGTNIFCQSDIVDFSIWLMFTKSKTTSGRLSHLLCQGFRREGHRRPDHQGGDTTSTIPGVISAYPNSHVTTIKSSPWPQVLGLLGKHGEKIMMDLLLDCGIYTAIESSSGSYYQLSGLPLGNLHTLTNHGTQALRIKSRAEERHELHLPNSIIIVRNRMLYARPALNARGEIQHGLRHIHVLNRFPFHSKILHEDMSNQSPKTQRSTVHVMLYIFPRQFGLHNVFTSKVDSRETAQPFKDYTMREDEISVKFSGLNAVKIPKRLRGRPAQLVYKLQVRHQRCPYKKLLEYYSSPSNKGHLLETRDEMTQDLSIFKTQNSLSAFNGLQTTKGSSDWQPARPITLMDYATPTHMVSTFCRAVLKRLISSDFWGNADVRGHNEKVFYAKVNSFVGMRRFESLSLHEISQGIKITGVDWLNDSNTSDNKLSQTDLGKRWEIFHEFLYYIFDSLLIPLIRANFHVTESNVHRYRLFYFRHDVWRAVAEPALSALKLDMFEELKLDNAREILRSRALGFSQIRLLPKEAGVRPIMNLRRRTLKKGHKNILGPSINSILAPVHDMLSFEKSINPQHLQASLFSTTDIYTRLRRFKSRLSGCTQSLYFAKIDVRSAFDTIPQSAIIKLITQLPSSSQYLITRFLSMKPGQSARKPIRKWTSFAQSIAQPGSFDDDLETKIAVGRSNSVFVDNVVTQMRGRDELLGLLTEHISQNMVKIGKRFYRQKKGIPQGSVLSSLLCNYFYADLEAKHLSVLHSQPGKERSGQNSLLLRLIDDFLLITTDKQHAKKFLEVMHAGIDEYGVSINEEKSLVNFEVMIQGRKIKRVVGSKAFPYCGCTVDMRTLDMRRDRERQKNLEIADSLTVEYSRVPGKTFHRKVLNAFKIQCHAMFLDTSYNTLPTVLSNLSSAFTETAIKAWMYARCLPRGKKPGRLLMITTIQALMQLAPHLLKSSTRKRKHSGYECAVSRKQIETLALQSFRDVLGKRQTQYEAVLAWISAQLYQLGKHA